MLCVFNLPKKHKKTNVVREKKKSQGEVLFSVNNKKPNLWRYIVK